MTKASIDIGSNSVLLLVKKDDMVVENMAYVTALGKGIDQTGSFSESSMTDTFNVLKEYQSITAKYEIPSEKVIVTATEASRVVDNSKEFFKRVLDEIGFNIQIISGEQEAFFSTKGVLSSGYCNDIVSIMDIGGASTELVRVRVHPFEILDFVSIPVGAVRVNDSSDKMLYITDKLKEYQLTDLTGEVMLATAGTMTSLAAMMLNMDVYVDDQVHNSNFSISDFDNFGKKILALDEKELDEKYPFLGKRRFTIKSGYLIASEVLKCMKFDSFTVSSRGLRYGTIEMETL